MASSSKLKVGRTTEYQMGANTELLSITGGGGGGGGGGGEATKLFLLCGADRFESVRPFRSGEFSVHMVRVRGRPISLVTCMVDDHRWMLAKDAIAGRVEARMFVFGLPGFFYGLELPGTGDVFELKLKMLEEIFASFSAYRDLTVEEGFDQRDSNGENKLDNPWARAYTKIEKQLATLQNPAVVAAAAAAAATTAVPRAAELVQRAVRSSAVVKLLASSLLSGALHPAKHLLLHGGGPAAAAAAVAALPSMSAVAALLTAIETGRIPSATAAAHGAEPNAFCGGDGGAGYRWYVNADGVALLLRVMCFPRAGGAARGVAERERKRRRRREDEGKEGGDDGGGGLKGGNSSVGQMSCVRRSTVRRCQFEK